MVGLGSCRRSPLALLVVVDLHKSACIVCCSSGCGSWAFSCKLVSL